MKLEEIAAERELWLKGLPSQWSDLNFHFKNKQVVGKVRVLPLNALLAQEFPEIRRKYVANPGGQKNPYGIFGEEERKYVGGKHVGSQKFERSFLMNITSQCHGGCFGCYKGEYTIGGEPFFTRLGDVEVQTEKLVQYLNANPEIATVIMSGGGTFALKQWKIKRSFRKIKRG